MNPHSAADHAENRKKVCSCCGIKCNAGRIITNQQIVLVKQFLNFDYDFNNECYPIGICDTCRKSLYKIENGKEVKLPVMPNFKDIQQSNKTGL